MLRKWRLILVIISSFFIYNSFAYGNTLKVVVFGDSLSDIGYQDLLKNYIPWPNIPNTNIPKAPTFTTPGGKIWAQYLGDRLNIPMTANNTGYLPVTKTASGELKGTDYAAGGATTTCTGFTIAINGNAIYSPPPIGPLRPFKHCKDHAIEQYNQIDQYLRAHKHDARSKTIYIFWGGANNILFAMSHNKSKMLISAVQAANDIAYDVRYLYVRGARKFIIMGMPDLGLTPAATNNGQQSKNLAASLVASIYNKRLQGQLKNLQSLLPHLKYQWVDVAALMNKVVQNHYLMNGFNIVPIANVSQSACQYADKVSAINCLPKGTGNYFFEDRVHPTSIVHQALADKVYQAVLKLRYAL